MTLLYLNDFPTLPALYKKTSLDGQKGKNREKYKTCQIEANTDLAAINSWLNRYNHSPKTYRNYKKEAERLILWCLISKQKAFSSLLKEDFEDYITFLKKPEPENIWCGPSVARVKNEKLNPNWKPFTGPLSNSSIDVAISTIRSLLSYLVKANYLEANPLDLIRANQSTLIPEQFKIAERILSLEEWQVLLTTLKNLPSKTVVEKNKKIRFTWIVALLYFLGLRVEELINHKMSNIKYIQGKWWIFITGKGNKMGKIPINSSLMNEMKNYRLHFNLPENPEGEDIPLIGQNKDYKKPITVRRVHQIIKYLGELSALSIKQDSPESAKKLSQLSPHWLRHFSASMQDKMGLAFKHIQANHRHRSDSTTRLYVHAFDDERHDDMEKLMWLDYK